MGSLELYLSVIREILGGKTEDKSLLDICCGEMSNTRHLKFRESTHIDVHDWPNRPKEFNFVQGDALELLRTVGDKQFDVALCSDGIEHLSYDDGEELLGQMERVARLAIIFTPIGPYLMYPDATDPDSHKSAWYPEDMIRYGWQTRAFPMWHPTLGIGAFFAFKHSL
jgi:hypothetical protein